MKYKRTILSVMTVLLFSAMIFSCSKRETSPDSGHKVIKKKMSMIITSSGDYDSLYINNEVLAGIDMVGPGNMPVQLIDTRDNKVYSSILLKNEDFDKNKKIKMTTVEPASFMRVFLQIKKTFRETNDTVSFRIKTFSADKLIADTTFTGGIKKVYGDRYTVKAK